VKAAAGEKYNADLANIVLADNPDIVICTSIFSCKNAVFLYIPGLPRQLPGSSTLSK
jgi:hypothetical protein